MRNSNDKFTNNVVSITKWIKKRLTIYSYEYLESTYIPQLANWHVFNANTLHFSESEFRFCYSRAQLLFLLLFLNINSMHFCMTNFHYENEFWFLFIGMTIFFFIHSESNWKHVHFLSQQIECQFVLKLELEFLFIHLLIVYFVFFSSIFVSKSIYSTTMLCFRKKTHTKPYSICTYSNIYMHFVEIYYHHIYSFSIDWFCGWITFQILQGRRWRGYTWVWLTKLTETNWNTSK